MADPHARLIRALAARVGDAAAPVESATRPWASVTFTGARHDLAFRLSAEDAARMADGLDEHVFAIPGHLVADIAVVSRTAADDGVLLRIAALTLEDR